MSHYERIIMLAALTAPAFAVCANAQVTTSAVNGQVVDENNEPVVGAQITAVHGPSGTRYRAVTNNDGRYTIQGMRTGGPYTITVSYLGYGERTYDKLYLELGVALPVNVQLKPKEETLSEATVTSQRKQRGGAAENFTTAQIQNVPTVDRNIYDLVKNSPMAMTNKDGGITFAGSNNRYNSFQVDGVVMNDVFGLAGSGTNGGQTSANPISMDAIQEMQVVVAPFDVRQSGFTGGAINVVTKQGTNDTHATAYTYFNNQSMYGKYSALRDYVKSPLTQQYERTYGGTLGGAIIKNKLFYFVSAEARRQSYPTSIYPGYSPDYLTTDVAQQIADQYEKLTGYKDSFGQRNVDNKSFGLMARLDWNISDQHKLAIRFQHNNSYDDKYGAGTSSFTFNNSSYRMNNATNSIVAELNSHLSDNLYNELRASATYVRDHRDVDYQGPTVQISNLTNGNGVDGTGRITGNIGTEYSSGANKLNQDIYSFEDNLSLYKGDHTLTFGTHNEFYKINNLFIQAANGSWYYNSLTDFLADNPNRFVYKYTDPELTGGDTKYAPYLKSGQFGFYAQDKWTLNRNFNATLGLRFDIPVLFNSPITNDGFNTWAGEHKLDVKVGEMPGAKVLVAPRLGFNWYTDDSHNTLLRGGVGIFTGRVPFVWLSNAYNNTGMLSKGTTIRSSVPQLGKWAHDPMGAMNSVTGGQAAGVDIVTVSKDFKYPQVLRANLALEQHLPGDVKFTLEGVYSKTLNNVFFDNLALTKTGAYTYAVEGVEASRMPVYSVDKSYNSVINLRNTNKGYTYALTAQLEKSFDFGLDLAASYTFSRAKAVNDGKSSVAYSNWSKNASVDPNSDSEIGFSKFDLPHRVLVQLSYTSPRYLNGWMSSTLALVYNGFSGSRYNLIFWDSYTTDINGDGAQQNSLLYIPTDDELAKMHFADTKSMSADESRQAFKQWIENDSYAKNHRGQFAERNSNLSKWEHQIDLHFAQNIYNVKGIGKMEFTFDIVNFTNMLNKKWGASYSVDWNYAPLSVAGVTTDKTTGNKVPTYTYNSNNAPKKSDISSRWHCQVGFRLTF